MAKYEGSPADKAKDKKMAKAKGMSMKKWEGSPADRKADAKGQSSCNKMKKGKK